jgi:hypothetical protein
VSNNSRPKVYFEEWDQPLISGIGWVSELIENRIVSAKRDHHHVPRL